jgi:tetratricopeptide (TPR) repeat protein
MALVDLHHGDKARAQESLESLRREAPNDPAVVLVSAMLYRLDGLYEKALEQYERLLEINPQDVVVVSYNRARIYMDQRDYERALVHLERARAAEPEHPLVKTFSAIVLFNQGRVQEAQTLMEDVQRQLPYYDAAAPILAWCLSAHGDHERAYGLITERVKQVAGVDPDIALWLASFYAMEQKIDEAIEWIRRAVRLGNENYPLLAGSQKLDSLRRDPRFIEILDELKRLWQLRRGDSTTEDARA